MKMALTDQAELSETIEDDTGTESGVNQHRFLLCVSELNRMSLQIVTGLQVI